MRDLIAAHIQRSIEAKQKLLDQGLAAIEAAGKALAEVLAAGNKLMVCGNGGSAGDAQHIATELIIRYKSTNIRPALPAISLATDSSALTACGNDLGFDQLFARQIQGLGNEGDILLAITTSGSSANIIEALKAAREQKMLTILLTGRDGGKALAEHSSWIDFPILIPADETARIQECHIMVGQILCAVVEKQLYGYD
ncbi:MAG: SIS domain-containing protein [Leptospiraceae bacterium]|nr:SIS domain-containing protein [Leptospiraceae bacterium]